jgi:hypothetical protein
MQSQESIKPQTSAAHTGVAMLATLAAILTLGINALAQQTAPSGYLSFDAPQAGTGSSQGTFPSSINRQGWIGGTVVYSTGASHGFLREPNGLFIAVDPPNSAQSFVFAINDSGEAVGQFYGTGATYGFLRDAAGNYTQLAVTGADTTTATGVNNTGTVVGYEHDPAGYHGFLWDATHGFTVFDVPGSQAGTTIVTAVNALGAVTGFYNGSSYYSHDFIRSRNGHFTTFEPVSGGTQTSSVAINANSQTTGWGNDGLGGTYGFLRNVGGAGSLFEVSGSPGTAGTALNDSGVVVGYDFSDAGGNASCERDQSGNVTLLTLPFSNTANQPTGINQSGKITGFYTDATGMNHGWVGIP